MEKLWIYLAVLLLGVAGGIVIGVKLMGDQIEIKINKIKNKRTSGDNSVTIPIDVDSDSLSRREERRLKRQKRKEDKK